MLIKKLSMTLSILVLAAVSCQPSSDIPTYTPTQDRDPQETGTAKVLAQEGLDAQATVNSQLTSTADVLSATNAQATFKAGESATAVYNETQGALNRDATATEAQAMKLTSTAEIEQQATAKAQNIPEQLQLLLEEEVLPNTDGTYAHLEDFDESYTEPGYFDGWETGYSAENFAVRADLSWSSASEKANWEQSNCGFIFGMVDDNNFHVAFLSLHGYVDLKYNVDGDFNWIAQRPTGELSIPDGEAEIMLVAYDKRVFFYVNGEKILDEHAGLLKSGDLWYAIGSGTSIEYGTRCQMTDVDLWIFE